MTSVPTTIARPPTVSKASTPGEPSTRHQRVLIVEDHQDAGEALRLLLELALDVPVDLAANGSQALEMLRERPYSVVITDLRMPHLSGMELLSEIQANHLNVTVVVTTG
jgi:DNA-binding NtrC family response regulator